MSPSPNAPGGIIALLPNTILLLLCGFHDSRLSNTLSCIQSEWSMGWRLGTSPHPMVVITMESVRPTRQIEVDLVVVVLSLVGWLAVVSLVTANH